MLLPSVTVVCSHFFPPWNPSDEAANRGKSVHRLCFERATLPPEQWSDVPKAQRGYVDAFLEWRDLYRPVFHVEACETHRISEKLGVHGTPDLVATMGDGIIAVVDLKSGGAPPYVDMQVPAYRRLLCDTWGKVDHGAWLILKANGGSKFRVQDATEDGFSWEWDGGDFLLREVEDEA